MSYLRLFFLVLFLSLSNVVISSKTHIVVVDIESKPSVFSEVEHWYKATLQTLNPNTNDVESSDHQHQQKNLLIISHVFKTVLNGFCVLLTQQQAAQLANKTGITAVMPDTVHQLHTTRSPSFLGLYNNNNNNNNNVPGRLLSMSDLGSDVIIGFLDTGISPEHPSFSDQGLGPIPSRWKGACEKGQNFTQSLCSRKIVGARFFYKGYEQAYGQINSSEDFLSARDSDGHGTNTASIAAGRAVANASLSGYAAGTAVGVAPKARIAVYKVSWKMGCMGSDILSAFDWAVEDGVDVISLSLASTTAVSNIEPMAIGAFGAMKKGVLVSASAGNEGPMESSAHNVAPWITTVGASTIDRSFRADLVLGNGLVLKGSSIYGGERPLSSTNKISIVHNYNCDSSLEAQVVRGKIVVCLNGDVFRQEAGVKSAGGAAIVVTDMGMHGETLQAYLRSIPGLTITMPALRTILNYIDHSSPNATATIVFHDTKLGIKPAPIVAYFSSRGPTYVSPFLMKPDLIAPGVNILAAVPSNTFDVLTGTSMSCPHISGVAALLKGAHPDWTPAMIKSAMMTTAYTKDNRGRKILDDNDYTNATAWAIGAGHVDPEKAVDPGLVYDISVDDYLNFLCASKYSIESVKLVSNSISTSCSSSDNQSQPWNLNYPAIVVDFNAYDEMKIFVTRIVTHVSEDPATYTVKVVSPKGVYVSVAPSKMTFNRKGEKQNYSVGITAKRKLTVAPGESPTDVGKIVWSDGKQNVVSRVVMNWKKDY